MTHGRFLILSLSACAVACMTVATAQAKSVSHAKHLAPRKPQSDVTVTKNPDGSVEVTDSGGAAPAPESGSTVGGGTHTVIYKPAPAATIHYGDGVVVHRNADGSVDVSDEDSMHPTIHPFDGSAAPARSRAHSTHHASSHAHGKPAARKAK